MRRILVVLALASLVAGCISSQPATPPTPDAPVADAEWPAKIIVPMSSTHDHYDWTQHTNMSTANFQEIAYDPLVTDYYDGQTAGGYFCGGNATTEDGREITVISSLDTDVAFVVVDTTDPAHPQKIGEYALPGTTHYDVDVTADGKYVVIGSDVNPDGAVGVLSPVGATAFGVPTPAAPLGFTRPVWRDACGNVRIAGPEQMVPLSPATLLIDIRDPANPVFADAHPAPVFGPHSVSTATIDGAYWVAASITNLAQAVDYFQFMQIQETPVAAKLVEISHVQGPQYTPTTATAGGGHVDAEITKHPVTGQTLAYLSNWGGGLQIVDLTTPATPLMVGSWADDGASNGQLHSTRSVEGLWDDKHYVIAGQEFVARPENRGSGWIYVIDDTDPANPTEVARWTLPLDTEPHWKTLEEDGVETWSTHYFRLVNRTLFVAMYHAGLWAVDLSNVSEPRSAGAFVPDKAAPDSAHPDVGQYHDLYGQAPFVLDVFPKEDYTMSVYDGLSGLYVVKYDPAMVIPRVAEWPMSGQAHED